MDRSSTLKILLFVAIIVLLSNTAAISRDFQDSWILEGLEIPFALFLVVYTLAFLSEKRVSWMVALAVIGRFVFFLIPNLKYVWFQGIWIDQHQQYALANHVINEGYIATEGPFGVSVYGTTPLIHLTFAIFSITLNIPVVHSIKYLPVLLSPICPLLTYVIMKKIKVPWGTTALKYALFISSLPIVSNYVVAGSSFGVNLVFLILCSMVMLTQRNDRRYVFVFMFFVCALAAAHSSSSVILMLFLLVIMLLQKVSYFQPLLKSYLKASALLAAMSIVVAWLMFPASFTTERIMRVFLAAVSGGETPGSEQIPVRFFDLVRIDLLWAIKSVLVYYGADVILLLMTCIGIIILLKMRKQLNYTSKFLIVLGGISFLFVISGLVINVGGFRSLYFGRILFPFFSAISILHLSKKKAWILPFILLAIILSVTIQSYNCQPLIPPANLLSGDLPTNEPIAYVNLVNSIYQRQIINFAMDHATGRIVADTVTRQQMIGLTGFDFVDEHFGWPRYYPLDKTQSEIKYDCFLIHLPGISGGFGEKAEIRTRQLILEAIYNSSIVYTNGESYMLTQDSTQRKE